MDEMVSMIVRMPSMENLLRFLIWDLKILAFCNARW